MNKQVLSKTELRSVNTLGLIIALRMLGLFMILPVFALYAENLQNTTPFWMGIALSVYGLSQAILQIPLGMLSDRYGRKLVISLGLLIFALGSVFAALATSIEGMIMARIVQGSGAISAATMALAADLTQECNRFKAMALIGMNIGFAFALSLILGPVLSSYIGLQGIFWITAVLAIIAIIVLNFVVPTPEHSCFHRETESSPKLILSVLKNKEIMRYDIGIGLLHMIMTLTFLSLPLILRDSVQMAVATHWHIYFPALILSVLIMLPAILLASKKNMTRIIFLGAIILLALALLSLYFLDQNFMLILCAMTCFFVGFNTLEAFLPSLISKAASPLNRGTAMGTFSSAQFLGVFLGGALGGYLMSYFDVNTVLLGGVGIALVWFVIAFSMPQPSNNVSYLLKLNQQNISADQLLTVPGVVEATVIMADDLAYLKIDKKIFDEKNIHFDNSETF